MVPTGLFSAGDVVTLARITYRQLAHWVDRGLIRPAKDTDGTGDYRRFDFRNIVEARVIRELRERGISLQKIRRCVEFMKQHLPEDSQPLSEELLLTDGATIYWCRSKDEVIDTLRKGQMVFAVFVADIWNQLRNDVQPLLPILDESRSDKKVEVA